MTGGRAANPRSAEGIFERIERDIVSGIYRPDDPLPSIRELASELRVSPATVAAAFRKLASRGLTYVERGIGTRVRNEALISDSLGPGARVMASGAIDAASGAPDAALLPDLNEHLARIRVGKTLYDVEPLLPRLREHAHAFMSDSIDGRPAHVTVASGALDSISDAIAVRLRPGDRVLVEDPGFAAALSLLRSHGLTPVPVPVDDEGFEVSSFTAAMKLGAEAVLYSPRAQNPRGSALTARRAHELREALERRRTDSIFVIENDHASLVSDSDYHSLTQASDAWLSTRSLSKSHGPDLRFALVAGDALTVDRIKRRQVLNRGWISTVLQHLVVDMLADADLQAAIRDAREVYARRRSRLVDALASLDVDAHGRSGLNVLVPVDDEGSVANALLALGWQTRSGQAYRLEAPPFIRLTPAALTDAEIDALARDVSRTLHAAALISR